MTNWPPYNPYANCCSPCGYNPNANALNVDGIIEKLRPRACDPVFQDYKFTFGSEEDYTEPCRDYTPKYDFRNNGEIYQIVAVQEPDE